MNSNDRITIGKRCKIHSSVVIGTLPQHLDYYHKKKCNDSGKIIIGNDVIIREFVNIHLPMDDYTKIGDNNFIMSHCHIAHDCYLEDNVILATGTHLAGYVRIMQDARLGLNCCIHQYTTIGSYSMIGMGSIITKDIPPFVVFNNNYGCYKINKVGMARNGFSESEIREVDTYYHFGSPISSVKVKSQIQSFHALRNPSRKIYSIGVRVS